jgi:teichuronic acid biosynthesis glycosyltransferase TuaH
VLNANERYLIWLSGQSWDCVSGTDRSMAVALSRYARVLWVDSPVSLAKADFKSTASLIRPRLTEVSERIIRLSTVALPGLTRAGVRATTPALVRMQVKRAVRQLDIQPTAVVMAYLGKLLGGWGDGVVNVLYGTDDYVAGAKLMGISAAELAARERQALALADIVMAVTPQLAERWSRLGAHPAVIGNGCWPDVDPPPPPAPDAAGLPRPVVGLVGYLGDRIDIDVLDAIADAGFSLLIVGARNPRWAPWRFRDLTSRARVRYVGPVPSAAVRSYLAAIDVGITPYQDTVFNRASFPLKTLEYLAAGLPVVTANLPSAQWLRGELLVDAPEPAADEVLLLAESPDDYVAAIQRLTRDPSSISPEVRSGLCVAFAEKHSWPRRAEDFAAQIGLLPSLTDPGEVRTLSPTAAITPDARV